MSSKKNIRRKKIQRRVRKKVVGTSLRPRLSVYRSNKAIYAQLIDDDKQVTLVSASSKDADFASSTATGKELAFQVGQLVAKRALEAGITSVIFDRNGYVYHGRVKALADGARGEKKEDGSNELLQF